MRGAGSRHRPRSELAAICIACGAIGVVAPARAEPYKPYEFGPWAFAPSIEFNTIFKDNLYGSQFRKVAGGGFEIAPSFSLTRDAGLHVTTISASETAAFFPGHTDADTHAERIGLVHVFRPWREQSFTLNASYNQSSGGAQAPNAGLVSTTATGDTKTAQVGVSTERIYGRLVTTLSANASFSDVKNANNAPIIVATDPTATTPSTGLFAALPSGRSSTYSASLGASYVGPLLSPFASVSATSQHEETASTRSVQMQSGVSIGRWRVYRGEMHVGYLISTTDQTYLGLSNQSDTQSPSIGGSITWDPLRYLSFTVGGNVQFGAIALPSVASLAATAPAGTPADGAAGTPTTPAIVPPGTVVPSRSGGSTVSLTTSANYNFSRRWSATAGFGYSILDDGRQKSRVETANVGASYNWSPLTDLSFSYAFTRSDSQLAAVLGQPFAAQPLVSNVVRAGMRRRF